MRMDLNRFRPFITVWVLFCFGLIALSGILIFFHTPLLGGMGVWKQIHIWLSFAFLGGSLIHLALNWKVLKHYFASSAPSSRQWIVALSICGVLLACAIVAGTHAEERHKAFMNGQPVLQGAPNQERPVPGAPDPSAVHRGE